jgi:hypothetical protein
MLLVDLAPQLAPSKTWLSGDKKNRHLRHDCSVLLQREHKVRTPLERFVAVGGSAMTIRRLVDSGTVATKLFALLVMGRVELVESQARMMSMQHNKFPGFVCYKMLRTLSQAINRAISRTISSSETCLLFGDAKLQGQRYDVASLEPKILGTHFSLNSQPLSDHLRGAEFLFAGESGSKISLMTRYICGEYTMFTKNAQFATSSCNPRSDGAKAIRTKFPLFFTVKDLSQDLRA